MGVILGVVTYFAGYFAILFEAISIACGLYYAAELAEEYPSVAKKVIAWATAGVIMVHVALLAEGFPLVTVATGVACHLAYSLLLITFPFLEILSFKSLLALVAIVLDHYVWFQFFKIFHFDIFKTMALFFLLVWLVPFALFISLTVTDQTIPMSVGTPLPATPSAATSIFFGEPMSSPRKSNKAGSKSNRGFRSVLDNINSHILPGSAKRV